MPSKDAWGFRFFVFEGGGVRVEGLGVQGKCLNLGNMHGRVIRVLVRTEVSEQEMKV